MLRSLAIAAISQQPSDTAAPTMADNRVYDSRLDAIEFTADNNELPCVIVYTDDDASAVINRGMMGGPRLRHVDLRVEILLGSCSTEQVGDSPDGSTQFAYSLPTTDAELEAKLDMFEQQVKWALMDLPNRSYTSAFSTYVVRIENIQSHVKRDEDGNNKLAARRMIFTCTINDDCPPQWYTAATANPDGGAYTTSTTPEANPLPGTPVLNTPPATPPGLDLTNVAPWIQGMVKVLYNMPSMKIVINQLTGAGANSAIFVPLLKRLNTYVVEDNQTNGTVTPDLNVVVQGVITL
jgi:hypothetical protein